MTTRIRASSLPSFGDCSRRAAARIFPGLVREMGIGLPEIPTHVGALVGSGVHAAGEYVLRARMTDGTLGNASEAEDRAVQSFTTNVAKGTAWDATTTNPDDAKRQLQKMTRSYREKVAPDLQPIAVEERLEAKWYGDEQFILSGQADNHCVEPDALRDLKTGAIRRPNFGQYGAYIMLSRSKGRTVSKFFEDFIKRVRPKTEQPPPVAVVYDPEVAVQVAIEQMNRVIAALKEFHVRVRHGHAAPEMAFPANPQSTLCSPRFCPAYQTAWCREALPK